jgi:hypothetical protein
VRQPTHIFHADWGTDPSKRWLARAQLGSDGSYIAEAPRPVGDDAELIPSIRNGIGSRGCALVGFDFPIGIPASYARLAGITDFKSFLRGLGDGKWADFHTVARIPSEISVQRPFYPFAPGNTRQAHLLSALGLNNIEELRRECEKQQPGRRAACPLFWTLGANQVGKGAIVGWRHVLAPALNDGNDTLLWPFDGPLHELFQPGKIVIAETYPAECYGWFFGPLKGKGRQDVRRTVSTPLLEKAQSIGLELKPELVAAIQCGFPEGDDAFDAVVGLFGMIEVVTGRRRSGEPAEERIRQLEGWILGQTSETSLPFVLSRGDWACQRRVVGN